MTEARGAEAAGVGAQGVNDRLLGLRSLLRSRSLANRATSAARRIYWRVRLPSPAGGPRVVRDPGGDPVLAHGVLHGALDQRLEVETGGRLEHRQRLDDVLGDLLGQRARRRRWRPHRWSMAAIGAATSRATQAAPRSASGARRRSLWRRTPRRACPSPRPRPGPRPAWRWPGPRPRRGRPGPRQTAGSAALEALDRLGLQSAVRRDFSASPDRRASSALAWAAADGGGLVFGVAAISAVRLAWPPAPPCSGRRRRACVPVSSWCSVSAACRTATFSCSSRMGLVAGRPAGRSGPAAAPARRRRRSRP